MLFVTGSVLVLLCIAFALWPLLMKSASSDAASLSNLHTVRRLFFRERIDELNTDTLDDELRSEMSDELGAVLLAEEDEAESTHIAEPSLTGHRTALIVCALAIPLVGLGVAMWRADAGVLSVQGAEAVMALPVDDKVALADWRARLAARASEAPQDSKSRYLLGHAELKLGQYDRAAEAFAATNALLPDDMSVQVYWLQARYLAQRGVLDDVSRRLARQILAKQPNLPIVLEVLAMDAYRQGDLATAVTQLNQALAGANDPAQQSSFAAAIQQIREQMPQPPPGVIVEVATTSKPPGAATVFVIARPVGGGMPYAVVKRPALLSPFTVQLDDLVSMSAQRTLSSAEQFEVVVRLSRSGVAMAAAGDWEWRSDPLPALGQQSGPGVLKALLAPPE